MVDGRGSEGSVSKLVDRLRQDADALENGPYTSIKEAREVMREAATEICYLRYTTTVLMAMVTALCLVLFHWVSK